MTGPGRGAPRGWFEWWWLLPRGVALYTVLKRFSLVDAIWVLYLSSRGFSLLEIGVMEALYHLGHLLSDLPSGAFADSFGRRTSLAVAGFLAIPALLIVYFGPSLPWVALGMLVSGVSASFYSGAHEALIYDHLAARGRRRDHLRLYGRVLAAGLLASAAATAVGGWLADRSFLFVYSGECLLAGVAGILALNLEEPSARRSAARPGITRRWRSLGKIVRSLRPQLGLLVCVAFWGLGEFFSTTVRFFSIRYMLDTLGSNSAAGGATAVATLAAMGGSATAHRLARGRSLGRLLVRNLASLGLAAILLGLLPAPYSVIALWAYGFLDWVLMPSFSQFLNDRLPEATRATVLSISSLVWSAAMLIGFPLAGYAADRVGLAPLFVVIGGLWILAAGGVYALRKNRGARTEPPPRGQ